MGAAAGGCYERGLRGSKRTMQCDIGHFLNALEVLLMPNRHHVNTKKSYSTEILQCVTILTL